LTKQIHIVALDVPYPADYGGAIDMYYRIKALSNLGYDIHLHCFEYGRGKQDHLNTLCKNVIYYKRKKSIFNFLKKSPFIVNTRANSELLENLKSIDAPIIFEGLHSTYFLDHEGLKGRTRIVRTHNIEHEYYAHLASQSTGWKAKFFQSESKKLAKYESKLSSASCIWTIKAGDQAYFSRYTRNSYILHPCIALSNTEASLETKSYVLFQGNLSVPENDQAVRWLCSEVFSYSDHQFIVAGKNPSENLINTVEQQGGSLIANPSHEKMSELINKARIHVLWTQQSTGVKLKLIRALQSNGHVLVNSLMVEGTDLAPICNVLNDPKEWKEAIDHKIKYPLESHAHDHRVKHLTEVFNAEKNLKRLLEKL